jgi:transposase
MYGCNFGFLPFFNLAKDLSYAKFDWTFVELLYFHNTQSELEPLKQRIGLESLSSTNVQSNFAYDKSFAKLKKGKKPKLQPYIHNSHDDSFSSIHFKM